MKLDKMITVSKRTVLTRIHDRNHQFLFNWMRMIQLSSSHQRLEQRDQNHQGKKFLESSSTERTAMTSSSSSSSSSIQNEVRSPKMSAREAFVAAIVSFACGALASYYVEYREQELEAVEREKVLKDKNVTPAAASEGEEEEYATKEKEKNKKSRWFRTAKAEGVRNRDEDKTTTNKKKEEEKRWFRTAKAEGVRNRDEDKTTTNKKEKKKCEIYTRADVAKHDSIEKGVWVTYKQNVYDVSEFLDGHPGGRDLLLMAAGKDIEPFWKLYAAHLNSSAAIDALKTLKIGEIAENDRDIVEFDQSDPYHAEPERHPVLVRHSTKPANMEAPLALLRRDFLTPSPLWFVRNHSPVPVIDAAAHEITIVSGEQTQDNLNLLRTKAVINLEHLRRDFDKKTIVATIQCGGNRRGGLDEVKKSSGTGWGCGAISTAKFSGALLRDVLEVHAGITLHNYERLGIKHVIFYGADGMRASIPIEKALSPFGDVLLAYEMNDCDELPRDHGYPIRVVVPGHVGVRNVKWLEKIKLCSEEADGPWNRGIAYKGFAPGLESVEGMNIDSVPTMQEMPIQSIVAEAENISLSLVSIDKDKRAKTTTTTSAKGFAWSGGGRAVIRVDVSTNDGKTWQTATLKQGSDQPLSKAWAWTFWEIDDLEIDVSSLKEGDAVNITCKATDASYNAQPENAAPIWNLRGLNNNSWHSHKIKVEA